MLPASLSARWLPREFVETTVTGGICTLVAYALMLSLFTCELWSFLDMKMSTALLLDHFDSSQLQINFDIDMYDIECRNLNVVVIDELDKSTIKSLDKEYKLSTLGRDGRHAGHHSTKTGADSDEDGELEHRRTAEALAKSDGEEELDSDWADSHDGFKHQSFEHVVQFHDFTLINFFAGWCVHCQKFAPMWKQIADKVHGRTFADRDGKERQVMPIRMNCVDFQGVCRDNGIDAFPTIRLYKSDGTFSRYDGMRSEEGIVRWIESVVQTNSNGGGFKKHHEELEAGCNAKGFLLVPRVPGHLEFMAGGGDQNLEPTLTNVSHLVKHLSFSDPRDGHHTRRTWPYMPREAKPHLAPLDGREFSTQAFHEAYEHHLRVVSTLTSSGVAYQFSHYGRTARLNQSVVPQARFFFDLEPFSISVQEEQKPWYDFGTSLLAILGGIYVLVRLLSMITVSASGVMEKATGGSASQSSKGLLT